MNIVKRIIHILIINDEVITTSKITEILSSISDISKVDINRSHISDILTAMFQTLSLKRIGNGRYVKGPKEDIDIIRWKKDNTPKNINQDKTDDSDRFAYAGLDALRDRIIQRNYNNSIYSTCTIERLNDLYVDRSDVDLVQLGFELHDGSVVKGTEALRWFAFVHNF